MVSLDEYAQVSEDATLHDAVLALDEAQASFHKDRYRHRAILVYNAKKEVVGKLSQWDVIRSLEPKYREIEEFKTLSRFGLSPEFVKSMMKNFNLWQAPLGNICVKAAKLKVKDIMYSPAKREFVEENTTLEEAIHQLVVGHHQSLLVTREKMQVVGILRLTDVFAEICTMIKACPT